MAESKLRIIIEALDKGAARVLDQMNKGLDASIKKTDQIMAGFKDFTKVLGAGAAAIFTVSKGLDATIGAYVGYGQQVRELSTNLGISTEETSRLIQVSDDFKISIEEVRTSLQLAAKNGFEPSVENLAKLADRLKAMESPTERAAELSKIFGRNWAVLNPLLAEGGDAIRDQAAAVENSLILTEDSVAATREWELALDDWEDSIQAAKIGIGSFLVEGLLPLMDIAQSEELPTVFNKMGVDLFEFLAKLPTASQEFKDLAASERAIFDASLLVREAMSIPPELDPWMNNLMGLTTAAEDAASANATLVSSFAEVSAASLAATALDELNQALEKGIIGPEEYEAAVRAVGGEILGLTPVQLEAILTQAAFKAHAQETAAGVWEEVEALKALNEMLRRLATPGHETGIGSMAGMQHGGSFIVGGQGGPDSQMVSFRASPGERVTVSPQVTNNMSLTIQSMADSEDLVGQYSMMKALVSGAH